MAAAKSVSMFEPIKQLKFGVFGTVVVVQSKADLGEVVIKQISFSKLYKAFKLANPDFGDKLILANKKALSKVVQCNHPNIVRVFATFYETLADEEFFNIVMEYCAGGSLLEAITSTVSPFPEWQIRIWFKELASAVRFLHDRGFLHRSIKPKHIFLIPNQQRSCRLGVFGLERDMDGDISISRQLQVIRELAWDLYCAPEQLESKPYTAPCDIWSLGVTFYHIVNLTFPFQNFHAVSSSTPLPFVSPFYAEEIRHLTSWMLAKDPTKRPTIAQVMGDPFVARPKVENDEEIYERFTKWRVEKYPAICSHLFSAVARGKLAAVKKILHDPTFPKPQCKSILLEAKNQFGNDILNLAALNGRQGVVQYLIEALHMNIESRGFCGRTPLMQACSNGSNLSLVRYLAETKQANLEAEEDQMGMKVIHLTASLGEVAILAYLLEKKPGHLEVKSRKYGKTPLLHAAGRESMACIAYLVDEKGADLFAEDMELGSKAIHVAAAFGSVEVVSYLLDKMPDWLEAKSSRFGRTPLLHAVVKGNMPVMEYLIKQREANIMANDDSENGDYAIHFAAYFGHADAIILLLECRPNFLEVKNKMGITAYERAKQNGKVEVLHLLHTETKNSATKKVLAFQV